MRLPDDAVRALQEAPYEQIVDLWGDVLATAGHHEGSRALCLADRFYLLTVILNRPDGDKKWLYQRCREVEAAPDGFLDLWAREHYKGQPLDCPINTPSGWTTIGALEPGSGLFGPDGEVCKVVARTETFEDPHCFEVEFDDGEKIPVSSNHRWTVERHTRKRIPMAYNKPGPKRQYRETVTLSTLEVAAYDHRSDNRLAIAVNNPLILPDAALPIDPYTLGAWLGDGSSASGMVCGVDEEVFGHIRAAGYTLGPKRQISHTIYGLTTELAALGIRGKGKKRIPESYLRASAAQRLALLQGLMDTDGHCNTRGTATFVNTNDVLVDGFCELANTLGLKPRRRKHIGSWDGEPYPFWQVSFQAYKALPPFRLTRKLARCKGGARPSPRRYIVACRPIPTVPMRCIQVDRPDGLYLTGRAMVTTHNSTIITFAGAIQEILRDQEVTIGIFSHTRPTAIKFLVQIKRELEGNRELQALFPEILWENPSKEAPRWSEDGIVVKRRGNPKEATVEAWGLVDGQPTGAHFRLRIYDDVVTPKSVGTPEQIEKTTLMWELSDNLGARGEDGKKRSWHIGTRYHFGDSYGTMLERKSLVPRIYPATDDGTMTGKLVFLTPTAWADILSKQSKPTIAAQQLLNPAAAGSALFDKNHLKFTDIRPGTLNIYIMIDPASSKKKSADSTAMSVVGLDASSNKFLLDGYCHRMKLSERWHRMRELRTKWMRMPGVQRVEVGYERYGADSDMEYFTEQMQKPSAEIFEIRELNWVRETGQSKYDRIQRLEPDFRNGRFYLIGAWDGEMKAQARMREIDQPWRVLKPIKQKNEEGNIYAINKVFLDQFLNYPFVSHDDFLDATSRVYDMEPVPPVIVDVRSLEPAAFEDS